MKIKIKGKYYSKDDKLLLIELAEWCSVKLLGKDISKDINVIIKLVGSELYRYEHAYATTEINEIDHSCLPKNFIITISNKFKILRTLRLLAHEMVHVRQHVSGELKFDEDGIHINWKNELINEDNIDYWDCPWEIEAAGREAGLVHQWVEYKGPIECPWYRQLF